MIYISNVLFNKLENAKAYVFKGFPSKPKNVLLELELTALLENFNLH